MIRVLRPERGILLLLLGNRDILREMNLRRRSRLRFSSGSIVLQIFCANSFAALRTLHVTFTQFHEARVVTRKLRRGAVAARVQEAGF